VADPQTTLEVLLPCGVDPVLAAASIRATAETRRSADMSLPTVGNGRALMIEVVTPLLPFIRTTMMIS
jgi:hypothetical protein